MSESAVSTIGRADDMVRASIRALMAGARHTNVSLGEAVGINDETLRRKLSATGHKSAFTGGELAAIADYFGRSIDDLVSGLGGMVQPPEASTTWRYLELDAPLMDGFGSALPRLGLAS